MHLLEPEPFLVFSKAGSVTISAIDLEAELDVVKFLKPELESFPRLPFSA